MVTEKSRDMVSVVIPVHNGGQKFRRCLEALQHCHPPPDEIIVVADGRSDGAWAMAQAHGHRTIVLERQGGPAHARNVGAAAAHGDILLFLDGDVVAGPDIIARIRTLFAEQGYVSAIIGSYDDVPAEQDLISQYRNLLHHFIHQSSREDASTFWGACGAIRKSVFTAAGGFDPRYRMPSIEDIELGYRLRHHGYRIRLQKDLQVTHLKKWSLASMVCTDILRRAIPWTELLLKQGRIIGDLNLSLMARLSTVLVFLLLLTPLAVAVVPEYLVVALLCCTVLFFINRGFYFFLARKRGWFFLLQTFPLHWLYFLYSGFSFLFVLFRDNFWRRFPRCRGREKFFTS